MSGRRRVVRLVDPPPAKGSGRAWPGDGDWPAPVYGDGHSEACRAATGGGYPTIGDLVRMSDGASRLEAVAACPDPSHDGVRHLLRRFIG